MLAPLQALQTSKLHSISCHTGPRTPWVTCSSVDWCCEYQYPPHPTNPISTCFTCPSCFIPRIKSFEILSWILGHAVFLVSRGRVQGYAIVYALDAFVAEKNDTIRIQGTLMQGMVWDLIYLRHESVANNVRNWTVRPHAPGCTVQLRSDRATVDVIKSPPVVSDRIAPGTPDSAF